MAPSTLVSGIFQGDLILRSAVVTALREIRENPNLIDDALASLPQDDLTAGRYGEKTIQECKDWFQRMKVDVRLGLGLQQLKLPQISIELNDEAEAETTLGDVNYDASEVDPYEKPTTGRQLASEQVRVSYNLMVLVEGEPELMLFLWTLVIFGILRHKEDLLDARGFNRLTWSVTPAVKLDILNRENVFSRTIRLNGFARNVWPPAPTDYTQMTDGTQPKGVIEDVPVGIVPEQASVTTPFDSASDIGWGT